MSNQFSKTINSAAVQKPSTKFGDLTSNGRRVVETQPNVIFFAHLSLYDFAQQFAQGKQVLDAGCGTGYGSFQFAQRGAASVEAIDHDNNVIAYAQRHFQNPALRFQHKDLELASFSENSFDLIFCSNTLQQLHNVDRVMRNFHSSLAPDGQVIIAVPFINSEDALVQNLNNLHQVNNLSPRNWLTKIERYFAGLEIRQHWLKEGVMPDWSATSPLTNEDFIVSDSPNQSLIDGGDTVSLVIVARNPRTNILSSSHEFTGYPSEWDPKVVANARKRMLLAQADNSGMSNEAERVQQLTPAALTLTKTTSEVQTTTRNLICFPESPLMHQFLDGLKGLEIGAAAHNPFGLKTLNVGLSPEYDAEDFEFFKNAQIEMCGTWADIDIPGFAEDIPVPDSSQDFVLNSHVWEHLPNPLIALIEWVRVVRSGGYIAVIVPKRDADAGDRSRPITSLAEQIKYFEERVTHPRNHEQVRGHYTVFAPRSLREMADWYNLNNERTKLVEVAFLETDDKVGNGHLFIWRVEKEAEVEKKIIEQNRLQLTSKKEEKPNMEAELRSLYLDLLKRSLYNIPHGDLRFFEGQVTGRQTNDFKSIAEHYGHTMVGFSALTDLQTAFENVLAHKIQGDLIETGVWRGGTTIYMRALLKAHGITDRKVWVVDSFAGVPPPNSTEYPQDAGLDLHVFPDLAVSLEEVRLNFARYGLLDNQVRFLKGWFKDTLPTAPIGKIAILRLDGDLYESTMDVLTNLYPKVSVGGYVIIDDYGAIKACRQAVSDYRKRFGITDPIIVTDNMVVYWQRSDAGPHFTGQMPDDSNELASLSRLQPIKNEIGINADAALIELENLFNIPVAIRCKAQNIEG